MAYTQDNRLIAIDTPLGKDILLLQAFTGHEGISRLFNFSLDLLGESHSIPFNKLIGQKVTLTIRLADDGERYINGVISRFAQSGSDARFTHYRAEVVPWLWFLTRTTDCRIFQNMTVPDIITKIFKDLGFTDFKNRLEGTFEPRDYCVQYRETDFNFVSRLMEQYGIFYFFEHEEKKHTLVLANSPTVHQPCPGQPEARCDFSTGAMLEEDVVVGWQMEQELRPGKYALTDFNFETPSTSLAVNVASTINVGGNGKYEVYDYPGEYLKKVQGEQLAKIRLEEEEAPHMVVSGSGTCRDFTPGYRFDLVGHYSAEMDKSYVLTEVQHVASVGESYSGGRGDVGESYSNHFTCMPYDVPFRPARVTPKPTVQGPQTAMVVGKAGEEIWTDNYGRVKVQFHWDREGKRDENSSCWIRVSHPWAGKGWGSVSIPRIGQEVIVDFLEGDPDQPIITGRVYNAEQMPPYPLPARGVVSGVKSNSTKGGGGYNEISLDDTKGQEKITVHGQYDMSTTVEHDDSQTIHNDRTITVDGTHTETIKKDTTIKITEGKYDHDVVANTANYHVKGTLTEIYEDTQTTTVRGALTEIYEDTQTTTVTKTVKIDGKANILIQAVDEIKLQVGDHFISINKNGQITISSDKILATAGNEAKMGVGNQNVTCDKQKVATSGAAINCSAVGMHEITGGLVEIN
jgi:type VI secretion system secreted protein VgrG